MTFVSKLSLSIIKRDFPYRRLLYLRAKNYITRQSPRASEPPDIQFHNEMGIPQLKSCKSAPTHAFTIFQIVQILDPSVIAHKITPEYTLID